MRAKMFHQLLSTCEEDQLKCTMSLKERLQSSELTDYPYTDCQNLVKGAIQVPSAWRIEPGAYGVRRREVSYELNWCAGE